VRTAAAFFFGIEVFPVNGRHYRDVCTKFPTGAIRRATRASLSENFEFAREVKKPAFVLLSGKTLWNRFPSAYVQIVGVSCRTHRLGVCATFCI